jgi:1-deoxy-D-xylulose-5-phosphate synthase
VLIHACTVKGKGYAPAEDQRRQVSRRREVRRRHRRAEEIEPNAPELHQGLRQAWRSLPRPTIPHRGVTAAMPSGTGLNLFAEALPEPGSSTSASPSSTA